MSDIDKLIIALTISTLPRMSCPRMAEYPDKLRGCLNSLNFTILNFELDRQTKKELEIFGKRETGNSISNSITVQKR